MATSLKIDWQNGGTLTVGNVNESCADATLNEFAQRISALSRLDIQAVYKEESTDITNAESQITGTVTTNPTVINFEFRIVIPDEDFEVITNSDGAISFEFYYYDEPDTPIEDGMLEVNHKSGNIYTVHVLNVVDIDSTRIVVKVAATELYTAAECYLDYIGNEVN